MSPTSFFLLTLLLVLVTEARGARERFSQSAEDPSSSHMGIKIRAGGSGSGSAMEEYSVSENSWSNFKSKHPSSISSESFHEESSSSSEMSSSGGHFGLKMRGSQAGGGMSSFKTRVKSRILK
ncbi:seminal vesicle secretory protein 5 precursor [Mus musculus]|uniref:Seminal vesicle secretory protein 5 n=3 Tax=Mus TaxID=10088 RepID=SVS5_MOUSE|nr:seminal vesicle secretory protein 5 precursor [Mus musculus]P30933.1 RecName: Full=Seminal vesicle secretory protein 5; AltName: Full=SVS protein F; AltName: Full=Seminal vesicle secretory protein V; Short=SVS V; Flags: Precursor [Mus musculus]AAI14350.1 Seminal vesicle secretory protein 5 [Mus musculus]EDL06377.1 seminal vesicle secretion 5 [Mus musculus]CAA40418.1 seminal vesicle F protein [Mus musculus]CAA44859.1 seminal vesicle secretory protein 5 [Mus musculus]BAB24935.1 unnamed prote|eukprot:NP_033327.1 seminal vesicle secretory protein 5 precursor [Mus musculus]